MPELATTASPPKPVGLLEATMHKLFTRRARIVDVEPIGYRLITLDGEALRGTVWTPGDKVQVQLGGWVQRTYTPIDWDGRAGLTRFLVHLHPGRGPGVRWAGALREGDPCVLFGPRKSIRLVQPDSRTIVFGDETSLGLAAALSGQARDGVRGMFEVGDVSEAERVAGRFGLHSAQFCLRRDDGGHLVDLQGRLAAFQAPTPGAEVVLSGNATSIQHLTRWLRDRGEPAGRRHTKAYWAPGKTGLD